MKETGC